MVQPDFNDRFETLFEVMFYCNGQLALSFTFKKPVGNTIFQSLAQNEHSQMSRVSMLAISSSTSLLRVLVCAGFVPVLDAFLSSEATSAGFWQPLVLSEPLLLPLSGLSSTAPFSTKQCTWWLVGQSTTRAD